MAAADEKYDEAHKLKEAGDIEGAVAQWKSILEEHPEHSITHQALAVYLQKLGQNDDAIKHALKVTELIPGDAFSFTQLSVIYQRCGKIQEAEDAMEKSRQIQAAS